MWASPIFYGHIEDRVAERATIVEGKFPVRLVVVVILRFGKDSNRISSSKSEFEERSECVYRFSYSG